MDKGHLLGKTVLATVLGLIISLPHLVQSDDRPMDYSQYQPLNSHQKPDNSGNNRRTVLISPKTSYCTYNNQTYEAGEKFKPDPCTYCHCPKHNDRVQCAIQDCKFQANCVRYAKSNDKDCCGQCTEIGCKHSDGRVYRPNEIVLNTKCERCICPPGGGKVHCDKAWCPVVNCVDPVNREGDCCKRCPNGANCYLNGQIISGNGRIYRLNNCRLCKCPSYPLPFWITGRKVQAVCSNTCT